MNRAALVCVLLAAVAGVAGAQSPPVRVRVNDCVEASAEEVQRIVAMELEATLAEDDAPADRDTTDVEVTCDGSLVVLRAADPLTGKTTTRTIDLAETPEPGRERTIGLAIVELVMASWTELETAPEPEAVIVERRATPHARRAARAHVRKRLPARVGVEPERAQRTRASLAAVVAYTSVGLGGGVAGSLEVDGDGPLGWGAELATQHSSAARMSGTVDVDTVGGAAWLHARRDLGPARVRAGVGGRIELARLTGTADDVVETEPNAFTAATGGPLITAGLGFDVARHLSVQVGAEVGYRLLAARARVSRDRPVELDGPWLSANVAIGWRW